MRFRPYLLVLVFLLGGGADLLMAQASPPMRRGLWVIRHNMARAESIDSTLNLAVRMKFSDLFVQVRGRGDAYYESRIEPRGELVASGFDPLAYLLEHPLRNRVRIHAWINVFYLWSSDKLPRDENHMLHRRPDWLGWPVGFDSTRADSTFRHQRNAEGLYASPMLAEVQSYLIRVVDDIVSRYGVDGIHLDYVRFPDENFDLNPVIRREFKRRFHIDPAEFKSDPDSFVSRYGRTGYEIFYGRWGAFLRSGLNDFVARLSKHLDRHYPAISLSAAVKPELTSAHWHYFQEWDLWIRKGWLDFAIPMNYTGDQIRFLTRIRDALKAVEAGKLFTGISLYNQPPEQAIQKILAVEKLNTAGYVLFSYDQLRDNRRLAKLYTDHLQSLENQP